MIHTFLLLIAAGCIVYACISEQKYQRNQIKKERRYDKACRELFEWREVHAGYEYPEQFEEYNMLIDEYIQASIDRIKVDSFSYQSAHLITLLEETSDEKHHQQILDLLFQKK
ncbi:MAG: hypothetical protein KBB75_01590 [Candidatus Pacebacteria bacterium]|nr:hypothetical protein [Candidatus Paceibacterota bacterium]